MEIYLNIANGANRFYNYPTDALLKHLNLNKKCKKISIMISAQINSSPHLGSIVTFGTAFSLAKRIQDITKIKTIVLFDYLENTFSKGFYEKNKTYFLSLIDDKDSKYNEVMPRFKFLLDFISNHYSISYEMRSYLKFQSLPIVRKCIIEILSNKEVLKNITRNGKIKLRTKCEQCNWIRRTPLENAKLENGKIKIVSDCWKHGKYVKIINDSNFLDMNSQFREIIKGMIASKKIQSNERIAMVEGGDWSGLWAIENHYYPKWLLGYYDLTPRLFSPLITDSFGNKLSKSYWLKNKNSKNFPKWAINLEYFLEKYDENDLSKLLKIIYEWSGESFKFFKNYSIDSVESLMKNN